MYFKLNSHVKCPSQTLQSKDRSSGVCVGVGVCVCLKTGLFKSFFHFKHFLRKPHYIGHSPLCIRRCAVKECFCVKRLSQTSHLNGRSPLCIL